MNKTIITTVGTSLLTNFLEGKDEQTKRLYRGLKDKEFFLDSNIDEATRKSYIDNCQKLSKNLPEYVKQKKRLRRNQQYFSH